MKIALVSPYDMAIPSGVGNHMIHLAEQFHQRGHRVCLLAPSSRPELTHPPAQVIPLGAPVGIPAGGSVARITVSWRLAGRVRKVLEREAFDVVHLHEPLMPLLPIHVLRFSGSLNIGTFHAAMEGGNRLYRFMYGLLRPWYGRLHGRIAVSSAAVQLISGYFPGPYEVIPNGIDLLRFSTEVEPLPELADGKLNILFVGRPERRKGLRYLLHAFAQVKAEMPQTRLLVVGPITQLSRALKDWALRHQVRDVVFTGFVPQAQLPRYYRSANVFCAPNTGNESQGIILLEAMACGTPVVASDIPGFADVVRQGVEGLLVRPADQDALAASLLELLKDGERRHQMGAAGRWRAQDFSWERVAERVLAHYARVAEEHRFSLPADPDPSAAEVARP